MKFHSYFVCVIACLLMVPNASASSEYAKNSRNPKVMALTFGGVDYLHRWSKDGQNEFTPQSDPDLATWHDMVTINVHEKVASGDQLEELATKVLNNYQKYGKLLRADSRPRTTDRPGEYLVVALLGDPTLLEAAFARVTLIEGAGVIAVYSHRAYGNAAGREMSEWLQVNGPQIEKLLMAWDKVPTPAILRKLPQSQ